MLPMATGTAVKNRVPDLLEETGAGPMDLVREAGLAHGTAYRLADRESDVEAITFDVLARLAEFFTSRTGRKVTTSDIFPIEKE